jgi:peptide/nickel transport system permease protein
MWRHVIPNCLTPVFVLATGQLGNAIVAEATLSFLGLGVPPPNPSWGGMLQFGVKGYLESAPWLTLFPGLALSSVVFAFALFGDALRDVLDPRLKGR